MNITSGKAKVHGGCVTTDTLPISAFIICVNEADRIANTLKSVVGVADEIVVVDSGSTDGTPDIAKEFGARVISNTWPGYGPQKRFAEEQCHHDWLLNLDADEVLSDALVAEIRAVLEPLAKGGLTEVDGFELRILDCVPGESRPRRTAHTTRAVRIYNKTKGRYADSLVHDRVHFHVAKPTIRALRNAVWHYSVTSTEQVLTKINRYSTMQAEDMVARGKYPIFLGARLFAEFPLAFLKSFLARGDFTRGRAGFTNSMIHAISRFVRIVKAIEARQKSEADRRERRREQ